jgi:hypothetical protein
VVQDAHDAVAIRWSGDQPPDWTEWERVIRVALRQLGPGPWDVAIQYDGETWRVAGAVARDGPRNAVADNKRRHRLTEALRAQGKPAGLRPVPKDD